MLKTAWSKLPIEKLCLRVTSGGTPSRSNRDFYTNGTIPWIKTGDLSGWYVDDIEEAITEEAVAQSSAKVFPEKTVLLAMYGDGRTMGSVGILRQPAATNQACCAMIPDLEKCAPKFLLYSLRYYKPALLQLAISGAQRNLNGKTIKSFEVGAPDLAIQRRIASILSAYDDLIENNTRRIAILEEMARRIYEEWFVRFRFPGHEQSRIVESELGLIPEGWSVGTLSDIVESLRIATKAGPHLSDRRYVPIDCIAKNSLVLAEDNSWEEAQSSLVLFERGDILFGAMRPYFHKVAIAPFPGVTRTTCFVLRPKDTDFSAFAALTMFSDAVVAYASAHTHGATIPYAVWDGSLANFKITLPPKELLDRFEAAVSPILRWLMQVMPRQKNLRTQRDLLLPKLISGEIDVSAFPEAEAVAA